MTQEEKELLLKDLSMRLRYKVRLEVKHCRVECNHHLLGIDGDAIKVDHYQVKEGLGEYPIFIDNWMPIEDCKPYLRPLSSMTEDEKNELFQLMGNGTDIQRVDFYNAHHFDYRGLIEKGLALEAPEEMYEISK